MWIRWQGGRRAAGAGLWLACGLLAGRNEPDLVRPASSLWDAEIEACNFRQLRSESSVTVRDGQALETNFATDPVTGKVVRLEVTVTAVK